MAEMKSNNILSEDFKDIINHGKNIWRRKPSMRDLLLWLVIVGMTYLMLAFFITGRVKLSHPKPSQRKFSARMRDERNIDSNAPAKLPIVTSPATTSNPTVARKSFFYIQYPKASYNVCDRLAIYIEVRDGNNKTKTRGGDFMWPYLQTVSLRASTPADKVIDHGNGSYTALFTLHWAGEIEPFVRLVLSSEEAYFVRSIRDRIPYRFAYDAKFTDGKTSEVTPCHITKDMYVDKAAKGLLFVKKAEVCDFSDPRTGSTWYCLKPKSLSCSHRSNHRGSPERGNSYLQQALLHKKVSLAKPEMLKNTGNVRTVKVMSKVSDSACLDLPHCNPGLPPKRADHSAGYYFKDLWKSKVCLASELQLKETIECLRNKHLFFIGDSTIRQWFWYLVSHTGQTMKEHITSTEAGVRRVYGHAFDNAHNITLDFRFHDYPLIGDWISTSVIYSAVDLIDSLPGGRDTVLGFTMCAHFTFTNLTYYLSRLEPIRDAIVRLQTRGTGKATVIIKSANTGTLQVTPVNTELLCYDLDLTMRAFFREVPNVTIIDVWDMTLSHRGGYNIHPSKLVVGEEVNLFLNFVCSKRA
ncbi:NXPE family member 3-like [Acanthaster planci]|uniref:NXPE family member 3-like n=1 Tax=Acanthaster planci TaxID=133434 RepID=A0A8B7YIH9_ACAPL|nr:NXPE family member 3-like [Acanthaster planci]